MSDISDDELMLPGGAPALAGTAGVDLDLPTRSQSGSVLSQLGLDGVAPQVSHTRARDAARKADFRHARRADSSGQCSPQDHATLKSLLACTRAQLKANNKALHSVQSALAGLRDSTGKKLAGELFPEHCAKYVQLLHELAHIDLVSLWHAAALTRPPASATMAAPTPCTTFATFGTLQDMSLPLTSGPRYHGHALTNALRPPAGRTLAQRPLAKLPSRTKAHTGNGGASRRGQTAAGGMGGWPSVFSLRSGRTPARQSAAQRANIVVTPNVSHNFHLMLAVIITALVCASAFIIFA